LVFDSSEGGDRCTWGTEYSVFLRRSADDPEKVVSHNVPHFDNILIGTAVLKRNTHIRGQKIANDLSTSILFYTTTSFIEHLTRHYSDPVQVPLGVFFLIQSLSEASAFSIYASNEFHQDLSITPASPAPNSVD
jgi:hypothetical protein